MKKIMIILLAILCIPVSSFAISLSTLENNPNRYVKVSENSEVAEYLDTYSVKSIRYVPPYYTLSATTYWVRYTHNDILTISDLYNYDYNYSMRSTIDKVISEMNQNDESLDFEEISTRVENSLRENSGINNNTTILSVWRLNGRLIKNFSSGHSTSLEIDYGSFGYLTAQAIFKTYYDQDF